MPVPTLKYMKLACQVLYGHFGPVFFWIFPQFLTLIVCKVEVLNLKRNILLWSSKKTISRDKSCSWETATNSILPILNFSPICNVDRTQGRSSQIKRNIVPLWMMNPAHEKQHPIPILRILNFPQFLSSIFIVDCIQLSVYLLWPLKFFLIQRSH